MISLDKGPEAKELCRMYTGDPSEHTGKMEGTPVYWLPRKNAKYRMSVDDADEYLKTVHFRVRYKLSKEQHLKLQECLLRDNCPEDDNKDLIRKFYTIREDLEQRLYEEMELGDDQYFRVDFPEKRKEWSKHFIKIGSTSSGKTWHSVSKALSNLQGPRKERRQFVYVSTELEHDDTLKKLMAKRYEQWVTGVDSSQEAFDKWSDEHGNDVQAWFDQEILPDLKNAPKGGHIFLDDSPDSPAYKQLMKWQNRAFRTLRHSGVGITSIQHSIRGRNWTSQSYSSVFAVILFPNGSGKGKIVRFLADDIGLGVRRARQLVKEFAEGGRTLQIRMWSPSCLVGDRKLILT